MGTIDIHDSEKVGGGIINHVEYPSDSDENAVVAFDEKETKKILHKVDRRLLPVLALLYLLAYLDRGNLGNAKVSWYEVLFLPMLTFVLGRWNEQRA